MILDLTQHLSQAWGLSGFDLFTALTANVLVMWVARNLRI